MKVFLGKSYLLNNDGKTRLISDIKTDSDEFSLWYEVEEKYAQYLVTERCDPFVLVLLPWIMMKASKIQQKIILECEGRISAKLLHQLSNYYIPVLSDAISYYSAIQVNAEADAGKLPCAEAVGTGISGGVDSSYTIAKYKDNPLQTYRLTHVVYNNIGTYGGFDSEAEIKLQDKTRQIAQDTGLEYIMVTSNVCLTLYSAAYPPIVPAVFLSVALALQKLFSTYYYSSGLSAKDFILSEVDAAYYDLLNVHCFSTENISFYSSGIELTRLKKLDYIADILFAQNNLFVCIDTNSKGDNCGNCAKCTRTMAQLEVLGKLNKFDIVFDVDAFRKNEGYHWGYVLLKSKRDRFCKEIVELYLKKNKHFSIKIILSAFIKWVKRGFTTENRNRKHVKNEIR
jgi:hypothetical protein